MRRVVVQKFGGTSVANPERMAHVARLVIREIKQGNHPVVVVSAMAGDTNRLAALCDSMVGGMAPHSAERDAMISAGEQVSTGLMALALQKENVAARALQGWQIPILTNSQFGKARIHHVDTAMLSGCLAKNVVPVIAGFQGVDARQHITTLGRGGSDTTAVAVAAALKAERCDIYTDVDGVYNVDPRVVPEAKKIKRITYEQMLELAILGAKVLDPRAVGLAMRHAVRVQVLSSFIDKPGTEIVSEQDIMEQQEIIGVTSTRDVAQITLVGVPDVPGIAARAFKPVADLDVSIDMIVQNVSTSSQPATGGKTDITFTVARDDLARTVAALEKGKKDIDFQTILTDPSVAKVSIVGIGIGDRSGIAQKMFATFAKVNINMKTISTSQLRVTALIPENDVEKAVRMLHAAFYD